MEEIKSNNLNSTSTKSSSLLRVGNFIKEARISKNESISELASNLKISEYQLKAIEDGREDLLPEKVFIKAMVRRIAEKLKLDIEFIMSEFNTQREDIKIEEIVEEVSNEKITKKLKPNNISINFFISILISGIVGLMASTLLLNLVINIFQPYGNQQEIKKI